MNTTEYVHKSRYFYGNEISPHGLANGWVDYRTLASAFSHILCNDIIARTDRDSWECVNGCEYDEETDEFHEIFQYYIISAQGASILEELTDEIVFYNFELDLYVWGVTHFGTAWDYVLTDIKVEAER